MKHLQYQPRWILFVCGFFAHSIIFPSYGDVKITREGLQILIFARHLQPLNRDLWHVITSMISVKIVISEDPLHLAFGSRGVTTCFNDFGLSRLGFEHPAFHLRSDQSNRLTHRCSQRRWKAKSRWHLIKASTGGIGYLRAPGSPRLPFPASKHTLKSLVCSFKMILPFGDRPFLYCFC